MCADRPILMVSPHLDDAVLSVGATVAALVDQGRDVTICTVFAGEPTPPFSEFADAFHTMCGLGDDAVPRRRQEDLEATGILRARSLHLPFLDSIYRLDAIDSFAFLFEAPANDALVEEIAQSIHKSFGDEWPAELWTCAAFGDHVDHRITRAAVARVAREHNLKLVLWEDFPYAAGQAHSAAGRPVSVPDVTPAHLQQKLDAVARYPSQLAMLYDAERDWRDGMELDWRSELLGHAADRLQHGGYELLWQAATSRPR
ncbi:PIG-L family deacetylase [Kribbella albertanoniae]|uniref:PIG-L family deacetylase n=2 Tax=Kribbella albertanoniae TaxID=1266829 RepID=A0A4R4QAH7_9ACTN|nr:PIG-L family deacetylase [Kribbella albertanoniae]